MAFIYPFQLEAKVRKIPSVNSSYVRTNNKIIKNKDTKDYQELLYTLAFIRMKEYGYKKLFDEALKVNLTFYVNNINRDLDNMIKATLDALQGVVFKNDKQIIEIQAKKQQQEKNIWEYVNIKINFGDKNEPTI